MPAPQAVVKVIRNGGTRSPLATKRQFGYLSKDGTVPLEFPESYGGPEATLPTANFRAVADEWALRTDKYEPGQHVDDTSPALTSHLVLSFPPGTDPEHAKRVGRSFASRMFDDPRRRSNFPQNAEAEHRFPYFTAFHTDRNHPHMHVVINRRSSEGGWLKLANREGLRSDPTVPDMFTFSDLRHELVEAAIEEGMDLEATTRRERDLPPAPMNDIEYRRFMDATHQRWRGALAGGADNFIRIENEIDEDGNVAGEPEELDRGHTLPPEWNRSRSESQSQGNEDAAGSVNGGIQTGPAGPEDPMGQRMLSPVPDNHADALARQQGEADLFALDDDPGFDAADDDDGDAGGTRLDGIDQHDVPDDGRRHDDLLCAAEEARDVAARRRHHDREDSAATGPSRRRTPAGVELVDDESADPADAPAADRGRARMPGAARGRFGPPNVGTRGIVSSETTIAVALQRWQQAEAAAGSGVVTRAQQRAVEDARNAWQQAEHDAQAARANHGRKRKRDEAETAASKRARAGAEIDGLDSGRPHTRERGR